MTAAPAVASEALVQLCAFRVGAEEYVIDLMRVREIIHPLRITPVPRAPDSVEGVVSLRGEVIPVVDVRKKFGVPPAPFTRQSRFLIVNIAGRVVALVVDAVAEVLRIPRSAIRPAPALVSQGPRFFLGVCGRAGDRPPRMGDLRSGNTPGGRRWAPVVGPAASRADALGLRLLLNVKALLEPTTPGELAAARELATSGRNP
jgi:purine-binding chemotaxis protein CheW